MENNVLIINADEDEALEIKEGLINKNAIVYCASTIQLALNMFMKHNFNLITRYRVAEQYTGIRFSNL